MTLYEGLPPCRRESAVDEVTSLSFLLFKHLSFVNDPDIATRKVQPSFILVWDPPLPFPLVRVAFVLL